MSELKRHHINEVMDMHNLTRGEMGYSFVYYADDADKVIAEKDAEISRMIDDWNRLCEKYNKFIKLKQEFFDNFKDIELEITK